MFRDLSSSRDRISILLVQSPSDPQTSTYISSSLIPPPHLAFLRGPELCIRFYGATKMKNGFLELTV